MKGGAEHWNAWGQYVAVCGAYALCYDVTLNLSSSHWLLTAGLRLSCLLLVSRRYWPVLALGEFMPLLVNALICLGRFGPAWAVIASVPTIVLYMAWVSPLRQRWALYSTGGVLSMPFLLTAALLCALTNALRDTSGVWTIYLTTAPEQLPNVSMGTYFSAYLLGAYLGALTVTPTILALHERAAIQLPTFSSVWRSPLLRETMGWVVPWLAYLTWFAIISGEGNFQQGARLAMALPVVVMACRHGWHGAAVAGSLASIAMAETSEMIRDPAVIQCQVALAFVLSAALWWGDRAKQLAALPFKRWNKNA